MPRFFFDVLNSEIIRDETGLDLDGIDSAQAEVRRALPEMAAQMPNKDARQLRIDVRDEAGNYILTGTLAMVVERMK